MSSKQRSQIVSESLVTIAAALDILREAACDLADCQISPLQLTMAINSAECFRAAAAKSEIENVKLAAPVPPGHAPHTDPYGNPEDAPCIACGAPESVCECDPAAIDCADAEAHGAFGHDGSKATP